MSKKPKHWQEIDWDSFKQVVRVGTKDYSPEAFLDSFYDDYGDSILLPEIEHEALDAMNWHYMRGGGKWFSLGLFYGIPKCCIFGFATVSARKRHKAAGAYAKHVGNKGDSWILCPACAEYVEKHGIEAYLANKAWEQE